MRFQLLEAFSEVFHGKVYRHRSSTQGDRLARFFYEDLYSLARSNVFNGRVDRTESAVNIGNVVTGLRGRRGDGTFGELLPGAQPMRKTALSVAAGPIANVQIGVEVKVLSTAMIKQIDRVVNDLKAQAYQFASKGTSPICVSIVGVNHSERYSSYEGERVFIAEGSRAPASEAPKAIQRLETGAKPHYHEFLILPFRATNTPPYPFEWVDLTLTQGQYAASLLRTLRLYESRFP